MIKKGLPFLISIIFYLPLLTFEMGKRFLKGFVETWKGRKEIYQSYDILYYAVPLSEMRKPFVKDFDKYLENQDGIPILYSYKNVKYVSFKNYILQPVKKDKIPAFLNTLVMEGYSKIKVHTPDGVKDHKI